MPREKDSEKREAILQAAKRLFAANGFHATAVSDIAREAQIPVGSVYTYFQTKEEVERSIIDEGWEEFRIVMEGALEGEPDPARRLALITDRFLPALFSDVDFISLFLAESGRIGGLEEKLDYLAGLVTRLIGELSRSSGKDLAFGDSRARAALMIFFLGSLDSVRLMRQAQLGLSEEDIVSFIRWAIGNTFGRSPGQPSAG